MRDDSRDMGLPHAVEALAAAAGLAAVAPALAVVAAAIKLSSKGPVVFKQQRMGRFGVPFTLYKFRTMRSGARGSSVTAGGDPRVTAIGRILRKTKLDELPELWNVVRGELALVGSRPEVPEYVDLADPLWQRVLRERPGITSPVTLRLRNEEDLLARVGGDRDQYYRRTLLPYKLRSYIEYQKVRTWRADLRVLFDTGLAVVVPSRAPPPTLEEVEEPARSEENECAA